MGSERRVLWGAGTLRTMRPRWMLEELGLDYESRPIGPRTGETQTEEFLRLNPRGKIPVLEDGPLVLAESAAIVTYLAETYGAGRGLIPPPGTPERAAYWEWCFFSMMELDATLYIDRRHRELPHLYGEAPNAVRSAREYFERHVRVAHERLADGRPFILGDQFTGADVLLNTCVFWGQYLELDIGERLRDYLARTSARPAHRRAAAVDYAPA